MNLSWGAERDIIYHPKSFCQIILSRKLRFFCKKTAQRASAYAGVYERVCSVRVQRACAGVFVFGEGDFDGDGGMADWFGERCRRRCTVGKLLVDIGIAAVFFQLLCNFSAQ